MMMSKEFATLTTAKMWIDRYKHLRKVYFHITKDGVKVELES